MDDFDLRPARDLGLYPLERLPASAGRAGRSSAPATRLGGRSAALLQGLARAAVDRPAPPAGRAAVRPVRQPRQPPRRPGPGRPAAVQVPRPGVLARRRRRVLRVGRHHRVRRRVRQRHPGVAEAADPAGPPGTPRKLLGPRAGSCCSPRGPAAGTGRCLGSSPGWGCSSPGRPCRWCRATSSGHFDAMPAGCSCRAGGGSRSGWASRSGSATCPTTARVARVARWWRGGSRARVRAPAGGGPRPGQLESAARRRSPGTGVLNVVKRTPPARR